MINEPKLRIYRLSKPHWTWDYSGRWEACDSIEFLMWIERNQRDHYWNNCWAKLLSLSCPRLEETTFFRPGIYKN